MTDCQQNIALCEQYFPKLTWTVESYKAQEVEYIEYTGQSVENFDMHIEESYLGYQGELRVSHDITLVFIERKPELEAVLQQIKDEWLTIVSEVL